MNIDAPRQGEKCLLDTLVNLCTGLQEADAKLIREFAALLFGDGLLLDPIRLVANKNLVDTLGGVLFDVCVPSPDVCGLV